MLFRSTCFRFFYEAVYEIIVIEIVVIYLADRTGQAFDLTSNIKQKNLTKRDN